MISAFFTDKKTTYVRDKAAKTALCKSFEFCFWYE